MQSQTLEVLPVAPEMRVQCAIYREPMSAICANLTDQELIELACNADARMASVFSHHIYLTLVSQA